MTRTTSPTPTTLLIAGHWLGSWAWDDVIPHLEAHGTAAIALTLPGYDPDDPARANRTLEDQATAILDAVTRHGTGPVTVVAHSGANAPVSIVLDRHPELIRRVVWVDSGPIASGPVDLGAVDPGAVGSDLADPAAAGSGPVASGPGDLGAADSGAAGSDPADPAAADSGSTSSPEGLALPAFEVLARQASLSGLSPAHLERFRARAIPVPEATLLQVPELQNPARRTVPTTLICCSLTSAQVREWARSGHPMFAETDSLTDAEFIDLPTGHWPMWSAPSELAQAIHTATLR